MNALQSYVLSKSFTKKTVIGLGAIKGANCIVKSVVPSADGKYNIVTFEWTANDNITKETATMRVMNGSISEVQEYISTGIKIATITVDGVNHDIYAPKGGSGDDDYGIVEHVTDLPDDLGADDRKIYYVIDEQHSYLWDGTDWEIMRSDAKVMELTQAEYDALSTEEKMNGTIYFITDGSGGGGSAELENPMTATKAVGGVSVGKTWNTGTPLEQILRDILSPVLYPTLTAPSASLSVPGTTLLEYGTVISKTFTCSFSQGSISPAYGTNGKRSGPAGTYSLNGGDPQSGNTFTETVSESNKTFCVNVTYSEGPQPKDSAGNNYSSPLPAGNVDSNTITYDFTYAIWSNAASSTSIAKMDLVNQSAKQRIINFGACAETNPETLDIPTAWGLTTIEVKNDLTGNYDECTDEFVSSSVVHKDAADVDVNYTRYTCNLGYDMGPREIRIKWS